MPPNGNKEVREPGDNEILDAEQRYRRFCNAACEAGKMELAELPSPGDDFVLLKQCPFASHADPAVSYSLLTGKLTCIRCFKVWDTPTLSKLLGVPLPPCETEEDAELLYDLASEIKPECVEWLWRNRLVIGEVNTFCGMPDVGKSTLAIYIAARTSTGENFYDQKNALGSMKVAILATEDTYSTTIVPRLMAAEAKLDNIMCIKSVEIKHGAKRSERMLALDTDMTAVSKLLRANPDIVLVVFDPLAGYLGKAKKNLEADMRLVLEELKALASKYRVCVLFLDHLNKNQEQAAIHRIGGTQAMAAVPRAIWLISREPKTPGGGADESDVGLPGASSNVEGNKNSKVRLMVCLKLNLIKEEDKQGLRFQFESKPVDGVEHQPVVEWLGATSEDAETVIRGVKPIKKARPREQAKAYIAEALADGKAHESAPILDALKEDMGISFQTARAAYCELGGVKPFRAKVKDGAWM